MKKKHQNKNFHFRLSISIIIITIISCEKLEKLPTINISPGNYISRLSDSTFLSYARSITENKGVYYISDYKNNRVICLKEDFNVLNTFGSTGKGPAEFIAPGYSATHKTRIFVVDEGGLRFNVFTKTGDFVKTIPLEFMLLTKFAIDNQGLIYTSTPDLEYPITVLDEKGTIVNQFGNWFPTDSPGEKSYRNSRHLLMNSMNQLVSVFETEPILELYNLDGMLIKTIDLSSLDALSGRLEYVKAIFKTNPEEKATGGYILFEDAYIHNDYLYLLFTNNHDDSFYTDEVLVVQLTDDGFIPQKVFHLVDKAGKMIMKSICKVPSGLIAYDNSSGRLCFFDL